jgi:hypothetical protein
MSRSCNLLDLHWGEGGVSNGYLGGCVGGPWLPWLPCLCPGKIWLSDFVPERGIGLIGLGMGGWAAL